MLDVTVRGAGEFQRVARKLREVGDKDLRRDLYRGINRAVKPLTASVKTSTARFLPDPYALDLTRDLRVKVRRRAAGANPAIFLAGSAKTKQGKPRDLPSLNRGRLRHPLFGDRRFWFDQDVDPGWWTEPLVSGAPLVRRELIRVLNDIERKLG